MTSLYLSTNSQNNGGAVCISNSLIGSSSITVSGGTYTSYATNGGAFYIPSTGTTSTVTL